MRVIVRLLMFLAGGTLAVALLILVAIHSNGSIETDAWIDRPPEDVWKVLTATSSYGSWNPMICRLSGDLRAGNEIEFVEGPSPSDGMVFHPTVLVAKPARELTWKGSVGSQEYSMEDTASFSKERAPKRTSFNGRNSVDFLQGD